MEGYDMLSGWGGMWLGPLTMFLIPLLVIGFVVWAIGVGSGGGETSVAAAPTPREILDERFAKGDIDEQEYERRRKALEHWGR